MLLASVKKMKGAEKVKAEVLSWIKEHNPEPGHKFFSQRELARLLKVDPMTAHKALNELTKEGKLYSEHGKGTFVGPKPEKINFLNLALALPKSNLENSSKNPENWHIVQKIYSAFLQSLKVGETFSTIVYPTDASGAEAIEKFSKYDAVFFASEREYAALIKKLIEKKQTQVAIIGCPSDYAPECLKLSVALTESVRQAVSFLAQKGYRRIGYIGSTKMKEKIEGYKMALSDYGLAMNEKNVVLNIDSQYDGARGASILIAQGLECDCIFVDTDLKAIGVIDYLQKQGKKIPKDIGVMGFDGLDQFVNAPPYLTTVKTDFNELIDAALKKIREKDNKEIINSSIEIPGNIIPNKTVKGE